jgi:mycothiol synthase
MSETGTVERPAARTMKPTERLRMRPYAGDSDLRVIVDLFNRGLELDGVPHRWQLSDAETYYRNPSESFDAARDVTIAELDGRIVGFSERAWVDTTLDGFREYRNDGGVLPELRRQGIGTQILRDSIQRSLELARSHGIDRPRILGSWSKERQTGKAALLESFGFEPARWFFDMERDLSQPIPEVDLPGEIEVREVTAAQLRRIWDADVEAFIDHWGGFDASEQNFKRYISDPNFDPTLWVIAWEGDEIAGGVINAIEKEENEMLGVKRGWLHSVFTRRPWRKRGLANALIARSLVKIRDCGMDTGILGVDADNPTGALGLYERNGFVVVERSTAWRKPLDLGDTK